MNNCTHETRYEHWQPYEDEDYCEPWSSAAQSSGRWVYGTKSACVDIDLHRYKCTLCGEVMYYSGRAKDYYEKGIACDVPGLGGAPYASSKTR